MFSTVKQIIEAYGKGLISYNVMWQEVEALTTHSSTCHEVDQPEWSQNDQRRGRQQISRIIESHPTNIGTRLTSCGQLVLN